jgi:alanyl-tRNA synthetase
LRQYIRFLEPRRRCIFAPMTSKEIRKKFLDFFAERGHQIVPSAPMVVKGDPTLMFINSGMAPFKNWFLGNEAIKYPRVADTQKCLRVSGKHNDLEEVGVDTYHHTMFEMLGNWSFGDYFKADAIAWAWELLTSEYKIPVDRLYVTVFEGDASENLEFDQEAYDLWKDRIEESRILRGNKKDNFWEMGDQGPCGPCSEIHVDLRSDAERALQDGRELVNMSHPQVIEIWNNVFMQFNRKADGSLEPLPNKHVDTGMGFERLCMALQGKISNYDTDVFSPIISKIEKRTGVKYHHTMPGKSSTPDLEKTDIAIRVISDHIRAVSFAIADGQLPSSGGAGYVIRRILRRAIRYGYSFLGMKEAFIFELVSVLADEMGDYFPEIRSGKGLVEKVIREEEESFLRTLEKGIQQLDELISKSESDVLSGTSVFELYDTFGFPVDLTALIAAENRKSIDQLGFEAELLKQKERSRAATKLETDDWIIVAEGDSTFVGYDNLEADARILRYRRIKTKGKELFQLVLDVTPFYPEGGGQVGDQGKLISANDVVEIQDTRKENNLIVHFTEQLPENISATFRARVNDILRADSQANHSVTHLLHQALREVLGTHVEQKGSLVHPDYLRFDFSHFAKLTDEELEHVEELVNKRIRLQLNLEEHRNVPIEEARKTGAMMLFGEKYGDNVRIIKFGDSVELCGGTHVKNTGVIGLFKITSEGAVAAGVRRIEAISFDKAFAFMRSQMDELEKLKVLLKSKDVEKSIRELLDRNGELQKKVESFTREKIAALKTELESRTEKIGNISYLAEQLDMDAADIKDLAFQLRGSIENLFGIFTSNMGGKPNITCVISDNLVEEKRWNASQIVKELAKEIKGGGGGQAFFATAGGTDPSGLPRVIEKAKTIVSA